MVWNKSTRRARERGWGAGRQAQLAEDFEDHRRIFDPCPEALDGAALRRGSGQAMIFKAPVAVQAGLDVDVDPSGANTVLESLSGWHLTFIEIRRARWGFTAAAAW